MKARILLVEDDEEIATFLMRGLTGDGYGMESVVTGAESLARVAEGGVDLVVLDRMLPDTEGLDLCRQLREDDPGLLILMLTAKDALRDKLEGLRAGADDYLTKPFAFEELLARIEALLRRGRPGRVRAASELVLGDLRLDLDQKAAFRRDRPLGLTGTEFALLRFLMENAGSVVSRMQILNTVWGYNFDPNTNIVEVYIGYLRRKLDVEGETKCLRNVRGFGYTLVMEETERSP